MPAGIELPTDRPVGAKGTTVSAVGENDSPAFPHPTYTRLKGRWEKCRALMGETQDIRDGREKFLARFVDEGEESYEFRLRLVALSNFFKRAVQASVGMLLENELELSDEDMPPVLIKFAEDIDLRGKHLSVYSKEITTDHVVDGLVATLVDYPKLDDPSLDWSNASAAAVIARATGGQLDSEDEIRLGLRPFFVKYERSEVLKVVYGKIAGVKDKILVVLRETSEKLDGDFGITNVVQYRVFRRTAAGVTWEVWEGRESGTDTTRTAGPTALRMGGKPAKRIPISLFGEFDALPPLENLADLNIEHHNEKTNIRNLESLAFVPTQVRIGATPTVAADGTKTYPPITLGPRSTIEAPYPPKDVSGVEKPVYWHSPDVTVLEPGRVSLEDIKSDAGMAALSFLAPDKRVAETAEAHRIDSKAQNANLATVGRALQDHLEECFGFMAEMVREVGGSVTVNTEFEESPLTAEEMRQYLDAYLGGGISRETFIDAWKRGKRLDETLDPAAEGRRILADNVIPEPEKDDEPPPERPTKTARRPRSVKVRNAKGDVTHTLETE